MKSRGIISILLLALLFMSLKAYQQVKKPDFAFPQTVAKEAKADLANAEKAKDAHKALAALIKLSLADAMVDPASLTKSIKLVEETAKEFEASPESGLYDCLLATMYKEYYGADSWKFDQRQLPMEPLPEDISEWSGDQFKAKIKSLTDSALSKADALSQLKIVDYSDVIIADKLTAAYFPTVLDFVCSTLYGINDKDVRVAIIELARKYAGEDTPSQVFWTSVADDDNAKSLLASFEKFKTNPAASLLLAEYIDAYDNVDEIAVEEDEEEDDDDSDEASDDSSWLPLWAVPAIDSYLKDCPTAYMTDWLKSLRNSMMRKSVYVNMQPYCSLGDTVTVTCDVENAKNFKISLYKMPNGWTSRDGYDEKTIKSLKPEAIKTMALDDKAPFKKQVSVKFRIKDYGTYVAIPTIGNGSKYNMAYNVMTCTPVFPIAINNILTPGIAVVNPKTGRPIDDASLTYTTNNAKKSYKASTNKQGIAFFKNTPEYGFGYNDALKVNYHGKDFDFSGVSLQASKRDEELNRKDVCILTDRGLYHPGDKVYVLVIASERTVSRDGKNEGKVLDGEKVSLALNDANWQTVETVDLVTDEYGRATAEFTLPTDGMTGRFGLRAKGKDFNGMKYVTVSDYRMPDFEINVTSTLRDTPSVGCVTLKGNATYYSGMPVADAEVTVAVSRHSFWRWYSENEIYSTEIETDDKGEFSVVFGPEQLGNDDKGMYMARFSAVSQSGTTAKCSAPFSLGKKYAISLSLPAKVDGEKPFTPNVIVSDAERDDIKIPLRWSLIKDKKVVAEGEIGKPIDLSRVRPGTYKFKVSAVDTTLAAPESDNIQIYNVASGIAPDKGLWTLQSSVDYVRGKKIEVLVASDEELSLYCLVNSADSLLSYEVIDLKPGYRTIKVDVPDGAFTKGQIVLAYMKDYKFNIIDIDFKVKEDRELKIVSETFRDKLIPGQQETWKIRVAYADGKPVEGAVALDMFNKALDAIEGYYPTLNLAYLNYYNSLSMHAYTHGYAHASAIVNMPYIKYSTLQNPQWQLYGYGFGPRMFIQVYNSRMMKSSANVAYDAVEYESADCALEECVVTSEPQMAMAAAPASGVMIRGVGALNGVLDEEVPASNVQEREIPNNDFRDADVALAVWAPTLTTDAEGNVCYTFTVPNANTTWKLTALAWTKNLDKGKLEHKFVASKPIMVAPNAPRFMRQGDVCTIVASVLNNTDSACVATTTIEIFNPANGVVIDAKTFTNSLAPKGNATVSIDVDAGYDLPAIGYRVRSRNGQGYSDGEQSVIPVLTSMAALVETEPFYLNPGDKRFETTLPSAKGARLSLTFCENPAWTIVTALPGLREQTDEYANSAAASLFSAAVAKGILKDNPEIAKALRMWRENPNDSALVSMLEKNQDLKIAMLNATPWVQAAQSQSERMASLAMTLDSKDADKAIAKAMATLKKLQRADGGWSWGTWCDQSSLYITANVLDMLGELKSWGWLPKDKGLDEMITKAVKYYDGAVRDEDVMYAIVRRFFPEIPISLNGEKVIGQTTNMILKNWKKYTSPAYKAFAAEALYKNNYQTKSRELLRSISEFGVMTPSQGLTFPSVNALYAYGQILHAYALIEPNAPQVDGLRQQLIIRKQGTDWGSAVVTTEVVAAILSSGAKWTVPAQGASITVGNVAIKPNNIESATGSLQADLSKYPGRKLAISTTGAGPAYGAVFALYKKRMSEVKSSACDDLDIEKSLTVRQADGSWAYADNLTVGDRVKVQLTIHCKRNLQYVEVIDERPAAFQPVDQLPGWMWAEGVGFYRENRDSYTALHVEYMRPGTYILTYEMNVGQAGTFSSGVATIQSQYAPEITAHSAGSTLKVK